MPDTDSVSWVTMLISAVAACVSAVNFSRRRPTTRVATTKNGTVASDKSVNGTDSSNIAITAEMNVTVFDKMFDSVEEAVSQFENA